jgi:hypothetical protein
MPTHTDCLLIPQYSLTVERGSHKAKTAGSTPPIGTNYAGIA